MGIPRVLLNRRRGTTLVKWWQELNCWRWPNTDIFGEPEDRNEPGHPRRNEAMSAILEELGLRKMQEIRKAN